MILVDISEINMNRNVSGQFPDPPDLLGGATCYDNITVVDQPHVLWKLRRANVVAQQLSWHA